MPELCGGWPEEESRVFLLRWRLNSLAHWSTAALGCSRVLGGMGALVVFAVALTGQCWAVVEEADGGDGARMDEEKGMRPGGGLGTR
jgi:hypothetical protein